MNCPHCQKEIEDVIIKKEYGKIVGGVKSERKTAACKRNAIKRWNDYRAEKQKQITE
jgi:hypothetical protein